MTYQQGHLKRLMYQLAKKEKQDLAVKNLNLAKVHLHQLPYMYV